MRGIFFDLNRGGSFLRDHSGSLLGCHYQPLASLPLFCMFSGLFGYSNKGTKTLIGCPTDDIMDQRERTYPCYPHLPLLFRTNRPVGLFEARYLLEVFSVVCDEYEIVSDGAGCYDQVEIVHR
jgi:hypothetical protein